MKAHERVGVVPMPARAIAPIDHDDVGLGLGDQRISERHSGGARSDDEIIGFDRGDGTTPSSVGPNRYCGGDNDDPTAASSNRSSQYQLSSACRYRPPTESHTS